MLNIGLIVIDVVDATAGCDVINHIEMFYLRKDTCLRTISGNTCTCTIVSTVFFNFYHFHFFKDICNR